jgi:hypothetical protein
MASELRLTTLANNAGTESVDTTYVINGSAKAWANFQGTGTVSIRDSLNQTSLVDNGTGSYKVGFTNNMNNGNYSLCATGGSGGVYGSYNAVHGGDADITTSQYEVFSFITQSPTISDIDAMTTSVNGDLA